MRIDDPELPAIQQHGVMLSEACPSHFARIKEELAGRAISGRYQELDERLVDQLDRLFIFKQGIGRRNQIFVGAFPAPRPTREQRLKMQIGEFPAVEISVEGGSLKIVIDDFGLISGFYITNISSLRDMIEAALESVVVMS